VEKFVQGKRAAHLDVELEFAQGARSKKYRAELMLTLGGDMYRVEEHGDGMHEAIDLATDALGSEISRMKKKKMHVLRSSAGRVKEYIRGFRRKV
jgi:ribosome-associated translation inhibitor RaiA